MEAPPGQELGEGAVQNRVGTKHKTWNSIVGVMLYKGHMRRIWGRGGAMGHMRPM